jgi:hypothetical protein
MVIRSLALVLVTAALATPVAAQTRVFVNPPGAARPVTLDSLKGPAPVTLAQLEATLKANGLQWRQQSPGNMYVYQHPQLPSCGAFRRPDEAGKSVVQQAARDQAIRVLTCVEQRQKPMVGKQR